MNNNIETICNNMPHSVLKFLVIVGIILTSTTNASAQNRDSVMLYTSGTTGNLSWMLYTDGSLIIKGNGTMPNYSLGDTPWSSYMGSITTVIIENGVESIGNNAFRGGTSINNVKIPQSVKSIRENAFKECAMINEITFLSTTPQQIDVRDDVFSNVEKSNCKLWVPDESVSLYRFAVEWRDFIVGGLSSYNIANNRNDGTSNMSTSIADTDKNRNEQAILNLYRKRKTLEVLPIRYNVILDGFVVANTTAKWKTTVTVSSTGKKTLSATIDGRKAEVQINFVPGEVYYVRCAIDSKLADTGKTKTATDRNGKTVISKITEMQHTPILQLMDKTLGESEFNAIATK